MKKAKLYVNYPIYECLIPKNLFTLGIGELVVTRRIPNGNIAMSCFMLDVFCLGVKDALFTVLSESDYEYRIKDDMLSSAGRGYEEIDQSCAKKLLDDLVSYAQELGFSPHSDYKIAVQIFDNIDTSECPVKYSYGKNGKPFYKNGPYESLAVVGYILDTLTEKCGVDGFKCLIVQKDLSDDDFFWTE